MRPAIWCGLWVVVGLAASAAAQNDESGATAQAEAPVDPQRAAAEAAYHAGDYQKTIELSTQAIQTDARQPFPYYLRASALIELGRRARSAKQVREGIADAREGLRLGGNTYVVLYVPYLYGLTSLADLEGKPQHAELAVKIVSPVLEKPELSPADRAPLFYQRGLAHTARKDPASAAADYAAAVRLNPDFMAAYLGEAQSLQAAGNAPAARESYDRALTRFPNEALIYNERGTFLLQQRQFDAALQDYSQALQLSPQFAMAMTNRGYTYLSKQDWASAEADLKAAAQLDPQQPITFQLLGRALVAQGKLGPAVENFSAALKLAPSFVEALADRGATLYLGGDFPAAIDDFNAALKLAPTQTMLAVWRYQAAKNAGDAESARTQLESALETAPQDSWAVQLSGYLLGKLDGNAVVKASQAGSATDQARQLCESQFFFGEITAAGGNTEVSAQHYQAAATAGASDNLCNYVARARLAPAE